MHDRPTRKIQSRKFSAKSRVEKAAFAPNHVSERRVDDQKPKREKEDGAAKLHTLGSRAGDQRRRDDGEHQLVNHERGLRNRSGIVGIRVCADTAQKGVLESADDGPISAETQAVAHQRPQHANQCHQQKALHHDRERVLSAHQAAVKERQAGPGHHQHQRRAYQHPGVIAGGLGRGHALIQLLQLLAHCLGNFRRCGRRRRGGTAWRGGGSLLSEQGNGGEHHGHEKTTLPAQVLHRYVRSTAFGLLRHWPGLR